MQALNRQRPGPFNQDDVERMAAFAAQAAVAIDNARLFKEVVAARNYNESVLRSMTDGLVHLLRREAMSKGVRIIPHEEGDISIELHIVVEHGVNIAAVCRSIINQVRYMVSENTGASIRSIDVCVDSMNM